MPQPIFQADAFVTEEKFSGNPAGVCVLDRPADERWMLGVAREMNCSETAFLVRQADGFALRWFTPEVEVALCGHATLASAHVLWEAGHLKPGEQARFHTKSGILTADRRGEWIEMDFPAEREETAEPPPGLLDALRVRPEYVGKNQFDYLVEVSSEETVRKLDPDFAVLRKITARGVTVTARSSSGGFDFVSRFFGPAVGVDEDPVTGSAHCCLGPYWANRLGKDELVAFQASRRGGIVRVKCRDGRVVLGGRAVTTIRGDLV